MQYHARSYRTPFWIWWRFISPPATATAPSGGMEGKRSSLATAQRLLLILVSASAAASGLSSKPALSEFLSCPLSTGWEGRGEKAGATRRSLGKLPPMSGEKDRQTDRQRETENERRKCALPSFLPSFRPFLLPSLLPLSRSTARQGLIDRKELRK